MLKITINCNLSDEGYKKRKDDFISGLKEILHKIDELEEIVIFEFEFVPSLNQFMPLKTPKKFEKYYNNKLNIEKDFYYDFFTG